MDFKGGYFLVESSMRFLGLSSIIPVSARDLPYRKQSQRWQGSTSRHMRRGADHAHVAVQASVEEGGRPCPRRRAGVSPPGSPAQPIISSAWKRRVGDRVIPSALAVLRLRTNSNFIGCSTGRSAGLVPFRILST